VKTVLILLKTKPKEIKARKYSELGDSFSRDNKMDSAFYYLKSTNYLKKTIFTIAYNLVGMAHIQQTYGDYYSE
jgi:hypothetical protein